MEAGFCLHPAKALTKHARPLTHWMGGFKQAPRSKIFAILDFHKIDQGQICIRCRLALQVQRFGATGKDTWFSNPTSILLQLSSQVSEYALCDEGIMLNMVCHAMHPSLSNESATAAIMLIPNCKGQSKNAYMQIQREHPE